VVNYFHSQMLKESDYREASRFFHLSLLLLHRLHLTADGAFLAPHFLQIFTYSRCFIAISLFIGSLTGIFVPPILCDYTRFSNFNKM